jgi:sugar fermentation stimulation protein A
MRFADPLLEGRLLRRYKRFLADIELCGREPVTVHVPNSGAMLGLDAPGSRVMVSRSANPGRKLAHTLEMVEADGAWVGCNTGHPNRLAFDAIQAGLLPELAGYAAARREVRYGTRNSRIDLLLEDPGRPPAWVEVKNVHLRRAGGGDRPLAEFPDCPTSRGAKHLEELGDMAEAGHRAVMLYIVQRDDCHGFRVAADIDPVYDAGLRRALARGVEAYCYACRVDPQGIEIARPLPLAL